MNYFRGIHFYHFQSLTCTKNFQKGKDLLIHFNLKKLFLVLDSVQLLDCNLKYSNLELTLEISLIVSHQKINFFTIKIKVGAKPNNEYDNSDDRDNPTDRRGQLGPHRQIVH
jgi:hypothetical protein